MSPRDLFSRYWINPEQEAANVFDLYWGGDLENAAGPVSVVAHSTGLNQAEVRYQTRGDRLLIPPCPFKIDSGENVVEQLQETIDRVAWQVLCAAGKQLASIRADSVDGLVERAEMVFRKRLGRNLGGIHWTNQGNEYILSLKEPFNGIMCVFEDLTVYYTNYPWVTATLGLSVLDHRQVIHGKLSPL